MKIALAADHGGFELKEKVKVYLLDKGYEVLDLGSDNGEISVDYPNYGKLCGETVVKGEADKGIVVCGTGIGISIAANKVKGIRCALCTNVFMAEMASKHNNANILSLGGRVLDTELALEIVHTWLTTEFEGGRHQTRVDMLDCI
ncbi:ribose 5-phosphate isomerase B [Anoxybacterium hadale]|uniref:Ribose 5-phosphate isomerase B n=1 Tax=Anoxybacterium hadale TaxID=3408580 RepID=A0ACD1AF40_9FIRM|nr:ribose 5-phosphate isomerase B [Clostridiales bacterium]